MTIQILDILVSAIGILMVAGLWHVAWRPGAVAHLRQDLFDARDFLFDLVVDKETTLTFESDVYRRTRQGLNSMIRFSHCISLLAAVIADLCMPGVRQKGRESLAEFRKNLNAEERRVVQLVKNRERRALLRFLLSTSPLFWVATFVVALYGVGVAVWSVVSGGLMVMGGVLKVCRRTLKDILFIPAIESVGNQIAMDIFSNFGGTPRAL